MGTYISRRVVLVAVAVMCVAAWTQDTRGDLFGVVKDSAGSVLAGVTVGVAGPTLPSQLKTVTDAAGAYRFTQVPAGTYTVAFTMAGFFPLTKDSVVVAGGAHVGLNVALAIGAPLPSADRERYGLKAGEVLVLLETPHGKIAIAVDVAHAPVTSANFLKYVDGHFYDGGEFHRATRPDNYTPSLPNRPPMELIQARVNPARQAERFPAIPLERTSVTGLKHVVGTVSMARLTAADTAQSDFFILLDDQPSLDFGGRRFDDEQGAAAFGRVVEGLDVVRKIQQQPVQGQNLTPPVVMTKASR